MAEISKIILPNNNTYDLKDATARASIPSPSSTTPSADGTGSVGSSVAYSRADHVHPTDTSRASVSDLTALDGRVEDLQDEIMKLHPTATASGAIASFSDGAAGLPVKSLTVDIEPIQSGSGDPSPDNIRPITGHTQAMVWREATYDTTEQPQITIPLGQTVYGGTLDVTNGVLTVDRAIVDVNTVTWTSMDDVANCFASTAIKTDASIANYSDIICDTYTTGTSYNDVKNNNGKIGINKDRTILHDNRFSTPSEFNTYLQTNSIKFIYQIVPQTIQLTPHELTTLLGTNNIWSDVGDVEVEYMVNGGLNNTLRYGVSMSSNVITLTGSDGTTSSVTLPVYDGTVTEVSS